MRRNRSTGNFPPCITSCVIILSCWLREQAVQKFNLGWEFLAEKKTGCATCSSLRSSAFYELTNQRRAHQKRLNIAACATHALTLQCDVMQIAFGHSMTQGRTTQRTLSWVTSAGFDELTDPARLIRRLTT